jgi:thiamine pyrophosphate-dependent acetolactate synthase large subunit-like protein
VGEVTLNRRAVVARLLQESGDPLVVTGLGAPTYDVAAQGDDDRNFYLWAAMGGAAMVGLGLALARPDRRVWVITGDGEMLMGMGALATVAMQHPPNLAIIVLDNGVYGETGNQASHTSGTANLADIAEACGIARSFEVRDEAGLARFKTALQQTGETLFARIVISDAEEKRVLPTRDGVWLKLRFRRALGLSD